MRKLVTGLFVLLIIVVAGHLILERLYPVSSKAEYGVTFSLKYARYLKLDWQKTYISILDDLKVKKLRIPTYWDILQPTPSEYDFSQTDYMLGEAGKRGARVILVLGVKQPRWPECHIPVWAESLSIKEKQQQILEFIQTVVERYDNNPTVWAWQVENEPLLPFGEGCEALSKSFLQEEVKLVRSLSNKTIIMTDSGELGFWKTSMQLSDIFGTTLYRQVYDKFFGQVTYPLPSLFYSLKSSLVRNIFASNNKETIIVELQAEPWLTDGIFVSPNQQAKNFTTKNFEDYTNFAKKTGFDEIYLWGVEWWYFMAANGYPEYLNFAKALF